MRGQERCAWPSTAVLRRPSVSVVSAPTSIELLGYARLRKAARSSVRKPRSSVSDEHEESSAFRFIELGERTLEGFERPVCLYRVDAGHPEA
jgi:hypothetical protein